jgi:diguanylate cyclase (GGDEF)-like protein
VAERLRECVRASDVVARIGGDEFTVTLPFVDATDGAGVELVATKIIEALGRPFVLAAGTVDIGASIGIACFPADADSADALVHAADEAMYAAKAAGRSTWCRYQPLADPAAGR